jgi:5'-nucleotidase
MAGPRILITNDDGVHAPGIAVMREIAAELSDDVWVVAPAGNQSGSGHRFSLHQEMTLGRLDERVFSIEHASPADCVVVAMTHVLADQPAEIVLSGVNNGQNLGDVMHCSGTAAGAREGALQGALGIALSQGIDYARGRAADWRNARALGAGVIRAIRAAASGYDAWYNVNFPFCAPDAVSGVRVVTHQRFSRSPFRYYPSENDGRFFVAIPETPTPIDPDSDFHLLMQEGAVTVTPVSLRMSDGAFITSVGGRLDLA